MKMLCLSRRNAREILRDPLNLFFGLGFPLVLLFLLSAIQAHVPVSLFEIGSLCPGILVFGLSFMTLFSAALLSRDRGSALLQRLYTAPLSPPDFILAYTLPVLPVCLGQSLVCCLAALPLGLELTPRLLPVLVGAVPIALFFIALGLLCGSIFTDKQVGGLCGALLTNLSAWLSGTWFDLDLVGGLFKDIAYALPFVHAVELERALLNGQAASALPHLAWVAGWAAVTWAAAVFAFLRQMEHQ